MSSKTKTPSKAIGSRAVTCNREMFDGSTCNRPVTPVFGIHPEECTSCACRIFATQDGFKKASEILELHYGRLRALTLAASIPNNPWAIKNAHARFTILDRLCNDIGNSRLMRRMSLARSLSSKEKESPPGKLVQEPRRASLGSMWRGVPQERAMELKRSGFEVRYIGVAWQVKIS